MEKRFKLILQLIFEIQNTIFGTGVNLRLQAENFEFLFLKYFFTPIFLDENLSFFYTNFFTPIFLHQFFLKQHFCFFLHQNIWFFYTKFFGKKTKNWCKKISLKIWCTKKYTHK